MLVSFVFAYARPISQQYRQTTARQVFLLVTIWKYGRSLVTASATMMDNHSEKVKIGLCFIFSGV